MSRWEPNARGRLEQAALELYSERGFDATTVAEITKRAGLTERTFFRHFTDKREVLFAGARALQELLARNVADTPASLPPLASITAALDTVAVTVFEQRREQARLRQAVIAANTELQERELIKLAALAAALGDALRRRGVSDPAASLAAEIGIAVFKVAFERWTRDSGERTLSQLITETVHELKLVAGHGAQPDRPEQRPGLTLPNTPGNHHHGAGA